MFDPEKVERWFEHTEGGMYVDSGPPYADPYIWPEENPISYVRASDFDALLVEYRVYKEAFEDVMYQEFSSNKNHVDDFLESARKTVGTTQPQASAAIPRSQ